MEGRRGGREVGMEGGEGRREEGGKEEEFTQLFSLCKISKTVLVNCGPFGCVPCSNSFTFSVNSNTVCF